ncbi:MAG: VTT domain-containing protein [Candidatus Omnitrophica bacterium]|nr:VTT domain-containing protein [Candidatus Omnitrophota bacterium]MBU1868945.1 VTT domain-containing protein [Candidatus Omnitrophota bacterium]
MTERQNQLIKFAFLIIILSLLGILGRFFHIDDNAIRQGLSKYPFVLSALLFVIFYVVVTFFIWFSKDIFRFAAAIVFGPYLSTLLVLIAETINACVLFWFARFLGRHFVETALKAKNLELDKKISGLNFFWLFLLRAVPLAPFRFLDIAAGLTNITFKRYIAAVILGSPLRIFWLQFILSGVGKSVLYDPAAIAQYFLQNKAIFVVSLAYFLLVAIVFLKIRKTHK